MSDDSLDVSIVFRKYVLVRRSVEKLRSASQLVIGRTQAIERSVLYIGKFFSAYSTNCI